MIELVERHTILGVVACSWRPPTCSGVLWSPIVERIAPDGEVPWPEITAWADDLQPDLARPFRRWRRPDERPCSSARWARRIGAAQLEVVIAPNGMDVSHLFGYYAARGFADDGRRLLAMPLVSD